jgi:hypothetical protein
MKKRMVIGKKDGRQVVLEWELEIKKPNGNQYDIRNQLMNDQWVRLSVSAHSRDWAGQAYDELLSMDEIYMDESILKQMIEYWKEWHLNDMRPGCIHQKEWDGNKKLKILKIKTNTWKVKDHLLSRVINLLNIDTNTKKGRIEFQSKLRGYNNTHGMFVKLIEKVQKAFLKGEKYIPKKDSWEESWFDNKVIEYDESDAIARWTRPTEHIDGILGKECKECNYTYGSKWLIEPLPDEVISFFQNLHSFISKDKQVNEIAQWMIDHGVTVHSIYQIEMNPHMPNSQNMDHWEYRFICGSKSDLFWYSTGYGHRFGHGEFNEGMKLSLKLNAYKKMLYKLYGNDLKISVITSGLKDRDGMPKPPMPHDVFYQLFEDISYLKNFNDSMDYGNETGYDMNEQDQRREVNRIWYNLEELKTKLQQLIGYNEVDDFIETFCQ